MRPIVLLLAFFALQTPSTEIRLIVKGDDMGAGHGINVATIDAYKRGVLRTTNVIVPGPWFLEAARLLRENPGLDVGVHLALTSEWENVKWRPLTYARSIVDEDGYFFPTVTPRPNFPPKRSIKEATWKLDEIERELRAQLDTAKRHLPQATYTWYHMGFTSLDPTVAELAAKLTKEYGLIQPMDTGLKSIGRVYESKDSGAVKTEKLAARLETKSGDIEARLRDLSQKGALLECLVVPPVGSEVVFVRGATRVPARVAWATADRIGLEFHHEIDENEVLVQLGKKPEPKSAALLRTGFGKLSPDDRRVAHAWGVTVGLTLPESDN